MIVAKFRCQEKTMDFSSELISSCIWIDRYRNSKPLIKRKLNKKKKMIGLNSRNCLYKRNKKTQSVHDHVQLFIRKSFNFVK